jgi:histidinol phosphatase-like enzyme
MIPVELNHSCLWFYAEKHTSLLPAPQLTIAAFDLDDTLIRTKRGAKFRQCAHDWQWNNDPQSDHNDICSILRHLFYNKKYTIVVFSNQTMGRDQYARQRFGNLVRFINETSSGSSTPLTFFFSPFLTRRFFFKKKKKKKKLKTRF